MNNLITISSKIYSLSSDFLDYQYKITNNVESIYIPFRVLLDTSIYFIVENNAYNPIKIYYMNVEYSALTFSDFNLIFNESNLSVENVVKTISPSSKLSYICKNNTDLQKIAGDTYVKLLSNWGNIDSINNELYKIEYNDNNYRYIGNFNVDTFININIQLSFTVNWISASGTQLFKANLCRVSDDGIIRSVFVRKARGGNLSLDQLVNINFLSYLEGDSDPFFTSGFYFAIDTQLSDTILIDSNDTTYKLIIFNDKIR